MAPDGLVTSYRARTIGLSTAATTRLGYLASEIERLPASDATLVIAPTRGAADDFVRRYCLASGRLGFHRMTLAQAAFEIATPALASEGMAPISGVALEAMTARAANICRMNGELGYFEPVSDTVGFTRALRATLSELRLECVPSEQLDDLGPSGSDMAALLRRYEEELGSARLADPAAVFKAARRSVEGGTSPIVGIPLVLIDAQVRNASEAALLRALADRSPWVAAVAMPQDRRLGALVDALRTETRDLDDHGDGATLARVRRHVFETETPRESTQDGSLVFFSATDEGREAVEIAQHIHAAVEEGGAFDDIAVLLRNPDQYQALVQDALGRAGIPAHFTGGTIRPNPSGRAFLALIACSLEGLSASRFAEYLSLGQVPTPDQNGAPPEPEPEWVPAQGELFPDVALPEVTTPDELEIEFDDEHPVVDGNLRAPFHWERLLVDAAVVGGRQRWERRLGGLEEELRRQSIEAERDDETRREHIERQIARLVHLRRFALPLIGFLAAFPKEAIWGTWLSLLEDLARRSLRSPAHILSVLGELRAMNDVGPVTLDEIGRVLADRLSFLRSDPTDRPYGKVWVATIAEASGRAFRMVFVPGLSEGIFPRKALEDPLLLDEFRGRLGAPLTRQDDRVADERLLLHLAAGAARDRLFVSYPRMAMGQGRSRVPSFYALDVLRAAEGTLPDLAELEKRARATSMSRLGWPSPEDASVAIDDAEYDLATIGGILGHPDAGRNGRGHYLLEANPHLARSLRTRARRWRNFWSGADGIVDPDEETLKILDTNRLRERSFSATSLQQFAACPYRFLLYSIHRLRPREQVTPIEQLDPLTRGSLFHSVQFRLLSRLRTEGLLPITSDNLADVTRVADDELTITAADYREDLAPAITRIWDSEIEDLRTDLRGWIRERAEQAEQDPGWVPSYFELSFGLGAMSERDPASRAEEVTVLDGIRLRGSIDMIEEHSELGVLRVTDHKTGRALAQAPLATGAGEVLQPMLYALAAESLFEKSVSASELSYCTRRGEYRRLAVAVTTEARERIVEALDYVDRSLKEGFLPAAPREGACRYCDYRIVCGPYEELRTSRKQKERLEWINRLRQTP